MYLSNINLTHEEKLNLITNDIPYILNLAYKIQKEGVTCIEDEIDSSNDEFLKIMCSLLSYNPVINKNILHNLIKSSYKDNKDYAKKCIQADVFYTLMMTPSISYINMCIFSFFGLDYIEEYKNTLKCKLPNIYNELFKNFDF